MTRSLTPPHAPVVPGRDDAHRGSRTDDAGDAGHPEFPSQRTVTVQVTGGLDGILRIVATLRGRRYRVSDLHVEVCEGVVVSEVRATVVATAAGTELLLERLRRVPLVVRAERT